MHVGITLANTGAAVTGAGAVELARTAEAGGLESLWTAEHVVVPKGYGSQYPYHRSGRMFGGVEDLDIPEPFVWLAHVAAATERIGLATGITVVPLRHPLLLAKTAASLDTLSGGRLTLGVGVGWLEEEFAALDVPFAGRGARTDEYLTAVRSAWTGEAVAYAGETISFDEVYVRPRPAHDIPIVVGGHSEAAARRAGRLGDGYFPSGVSRERVLELWGIARRSAEDHGRDPDRVELTVAGRPDRDTAEWWAERGAHRMLFAGDLRLVEHVAESVIPAL